MTDETKQVIEKIYADIEQKKQKAENDKMSFAFVQGMQAALDVVNDYLPNMRCRCDMTDETIKMIEDIKTEIETLIADDTVGTIGIINKHIEDIERK